MTSSAPTHGTFLVPEWFTSDHDRVRLLGKAIGFLLYLYACADEATGTGTVSIAEYARRAGIPYRTVQRYRETLEAIGEVAFAEVHAGRRSHLAYRLIGYPVEGVL